MSSPVRAATTTAAIAALLLGAAACGSSKTKSSAPKPSATTPTASATPSSSGPSVTPTSAATRSVAPTGPVTPPATALVTVSPVPVRTQTPVAPSGTGTFGGGVTVKITKIAAVTSKGTGPGEISGKPAVALTLTLTNGTSSALSLDSVAVTTVYGADATPASPDDGAPSAPFSGSVAAQKSASGTYVFVLPVADRGNVTVSMSYTAKQPTVLFHGAL